MVFENLLLVNEEGILTITINRPEKRNALNLRTMQELEAAFQLVHTDEAIRGVIITGAGDKAFVAGADISEIATLNVANAKKFSIKGQEIFRTIETCSKPVIAAVNGYALGGGCELAMACHMRIASENAQFGQPEVNLGIIPGYGGTQRLTYLVGRAKALELMLTGDMITAVEALQWGLINHLAPTIEAMMQKAREILHKIMRKAPVAVAQVIRAANAAFSFSDGYAIEAEAFSICCQTEDFKEGTAAFLQKRPANFVGK
ncbi:MAG: enoyl-CoA hydratase-related protein [Cytophagales bacterium]|nr:enoyl-CoA hydratase-related protein [Bernardetiaceae bacterium]MDW8210364.1 enoyl-CoA hydratase-related protein [Cytophagales bacterium]